MSTTNIHTNLYINTPSAFSSLSTVGTSGDTSDRLVAVAEASLDRTAGETLISQGVCIDILLDLYMATDDIGLRWSIGDRIEDLRGRQFVLEEELRADLHAILAIAAFARIADAILAA